MKYRCPDCKTKIHLYEVYSSFFYCETCKKDFPIEENKDIKIMCSDCEVKKPTWPPKII